MKKKIVHFLSNLFPSIFTNLAFNQLTNPQVKKLRENELAILNKAIQEDFQFKNFNIKTYKWGTGQDSVLLIHGWEGQAGNFSDLVEKLTQINFTVYAFDGPSHGYSSKGGTSLFEFSELVEIMISKFNVNKLISHSFGGVATTFALYNNPNLKIEKYALLTTPDKFSERIDDVSEMVGISNKVKVNLIKKLETESGINANTLNVSDFVKKINVIDALILHDKNDKVIPIDRSLNVHNNWPQSKFEEIEGTGHFRILRTDNVLDKVIEFIS